MKYLFQSGLPDLPVGNDKDTAQTRPLYMAIGNISKELAVSTGKFELDQVEAGSRSQLEFLSTGKLHRIYVLADGGSLAYGKLINLYIAGGKIAGRLADQSAVPVGDRRAHAVIDEPNGIAAGAYGKALFLEGMTAGIAGSVFAAPYYLSTAGNVQLAIPGAGLIQPVGYGMGSAGFYLRIN